MKPSQYIKSTDMDDAYDNLFAENKKLLSKLEKLKPITPKLIDVEVINAIASVIRITENMTAKEINSIAKYIRSAGE